ncbi:glycosyltransferase family 4 protein [Magnetospirillum sp. SS-4]|uniref:glycosyltransferase family 4 protein n=1 Tax=Magnetospirillum sp. SS-4 TaxID=2681465 RepID=UPI00137E4643|nr:glycosyltransferase family 4 protein [Magnetospirillum sp. SS-4]CAA7621945.1 Glycosyltransferase [Magnetospirillum sp. SS-4]
MNRPCIAHIIDDPAVGGVTRVIERMAVSALSHHYDFETVVMDSTSFRPPFLHHDAMVVHYTLSWRKLPHLALLKAANPHTPLILAEHSYSQAFEDLHVPSKARYHAMLRLAYGLADHVVANSEAVGQWMLRHRLVAEGKLSVIRQSWDISDLTSLPLPIHGKAQPLVVGAYGRFCGQKGFEHLIRAMALLSPQEAILRLGGMGPDENKLRQLADGLGNVTFCGQVKDLAGFLSGCNVVAIPSMFEPFGLVCLEAKAAGRPVIASAVDGLVEQVSGNGLLVPPAAPHALADAIRQMARRDLGKMGAIGRQDARGSWDRFMQQWTHLYSKLLPQMPLSLREPHELAR